MCFSRRELEKAAALFEKAELANPADYQTPVLLAQTYRALGRLDKSESTLRWALEVLQRQLDVRPDDTRAMYMKAAAHLELRERETAMIWAQRALSFDPDDPPVLYFMSCLYSRMGEIDEALGYLERAVSSGFSHGEWLLVDPDMAAIRHHPRFKAVIDKVS
jgi:adenylate cyclase